MDAQLWHPRRSRMIGRSRIHRADYTRHGARVRRSGVVDGITLPDVQRIVRTSARTDRVRRRHVRAARRLASAGTPMRTRFPPLWKGSRFPMEIISGWAMLSPRRRRHSRHLQRSALPLGRTARHFVKEPRHGARLEAGSDRRDRQLGLPASAVGPGGVYCTGRHHLGGRHGERPGVLELELAGFRH